VPRPRTPPASNPANTTAGPTIGLIRRSGRFGLAIRLALSPALQDVPEIERPEGERREAEHHDTGPIQSIDGRHGASPSTGQVPGTPDAGQGGGAADEDDVGSGGTLETDSHVVVTAA
jgi:hypothetical protein